MRQVTIRGVTYESIAAASRALGVSPSTVSSAVARGALDSVGLSLAGSPTPTVYRGIVYPSQVAAAKAAGVKPSTVNNHLERHGNLDNIGELVKEPITIRGRRYPSIAHASRSIRVTREAIRMAEKNGTLDTVGVGIKFWVGKPTVYRGVEYSSQAKAAKAAKVSTGTTRHYIQTYGSLAKLEEKQDEKKREANRKKYQNRKRAKSRQPNGCERCEDR